MEPVTFIQIWRKPPELRRLAFPTIPKTLTRKPENHVAPNWEQVPLDS